MTNPIKLHFCAREINMLTDGAWRRSGHVLHGVRCVDSQVFASLPLTGSGGSEPVLPLSPVWTSQLCSDSPYPTSPASFIPPSPPFCRLWCVSPPRRLKFYTRAPSLCPGRSSLDLGHGGVVLGQDLHQFVSPVKRVPEPAQLSRDLGGGWDLWKIDHVTQVGSQV